MRSAELAIIISYPTSASGIIVSLIKNHQQILPDFADFAWLEQPEGNLMDAISRVWYNGSYTIAAKPIKTLESHYTMIQFLIMSDIIR